MTRSQLRAGAVVLGPGRGKPGGLERPSGQSRRPGRHFRAGTVAPAAGQSRIATQGFADVVSKVTPAVVTIRTERNASPQMTQLPQFPRASRSVICSASARRVAAGRCRRRCSAASAQASSSATTATS